MHSYRIGALLLALTTFATAQSPLHLIPVPREVSPAANQSLSSGVEIDCVAPCAADDVFAVEDFKAFLSARNIAVSNSAPVHILVTRYGSTLSKSIYTESLPRGTSGSQAQPTPEIKAEGYAIVPDKKGLALTAFTSSGV